MLTHPHGCNLRNGRHSEPDRIYLITTVTRQRYPWFSDWRFGRIVAQTLYREKANAKTLAYVVMPDHFHWLVKLRDGDYLAAVMRTVKAVSSRRINMLQDEPQPIWQHGYHDHALRKEDDQLKMARYLVANPLRAGLVKRLGDYPLWDAAWI